MDDFPTGSIQSSALIIRPNNEADDSSASLLGRMMSADEWMTSLREVIPCWVGKKS
jgi:hypothetical protein